MHIHASTGTHSQLLAAGLFCVCLLYITQRSIIIRQYKWIVSETAATHTPLIIIDCKTISAFAVNIGITFKSPEEFFLGEQPRKWIWRGFDPSTLADAAPAAAAGMCKHTSHCYFDPALADAAHAEGPCKYP